MIDYFVRRTHGSGANKGSVADRFWRMVRSAKPGECWEWVGSRRAGYGRMAVGRPAGLPRDTVITAHRIAYEMLIGPIPEGLVIDHLCRNKSCVNPAHLEAVSQRENVLRGYRMKLTKGSRRWKRAQTVEARSDG